MIGRLLSRIALALAATGTAQAPALAAPSGTQIGSWMLNNMIVAGPSTGPAYVLSAYLVEDDARSPSFSLRCEDGHFGVQLFSQSGPHLPEGGRATEFQVAVDGGTPMLLVGKHTSFGPTQIIEGAASPGLLDALAAAEHRMTVTAPALKTSFMFDLRETAKAIRLFRATCQP